MLFLVKREVTQREYMQDGSTSFERTYIVEADSEDQAELLVTSEWEDKSDYNGGSSYSVDIECTTPQLKW